MMMKKVSKKDILKKRNPPVKSHDVPVTAGMLFSVRDELKSDIGSVRSDLKSVRSEVASVREDVKAVRSEVASVREDVKAVRSEVASVREDVKSLEHKMDAKFDKVLAEVHRIGLLVEDQNARNKYVLDGYTSLSDRLGKVEGKVFKDGA